MTSQLNYNDIVQCCNTCSEPEATTTQAGTTQAGTTQAGTTQERFTDLQCKCDEINYCPLKDTFCTSITDRYECISKGCDRGSDITKFECVNPGTRSMGVGTPSDLNCEDSELICNMDKDGNIVYGKCVENELGTKNFMSYNSKCVSQANPITNFCNGDIPQLVDPCLDRSVPTTAAGAAPTATTTGNVPTENVPTATTTGNVPNGAGPTVTTTGNETTEEPEGSNSDDMNNYANNNADNSELIYFFHEEGENGETLYEYQFNNEEALKERRDIENASEDSYDRHLGKKVLTNDTGLQYLYDPYTDSLTSFNDSKNIKKRVRKMEDRMKFLEETVQDSTSINLKNSDDVRNKLVFPVLNSNSNSNNVVYLSNDFGNSEHPELNTEINNSPKNTVGEVKVTSEEANKILEEQKEDENENEDETGSESVESPEEEVEKKGLSLALKIIIILIVLSVLGLVIFLLNKFGVLHKLTKKSNNLMKNNSFNLNNTTNNILKNLPRK